jgi:hypothetical protein
VGRHYEIIKRHCHLQIKRGSKIRGFRKRQWAFSEVVHLKGAIPALRGHQAAKSRRPSHTRQRTQHCEASTMHGADHGTERRKVGKTNYQAQGALFIPEEA